MHTIKLGNVISIVPQYIGVITRIVDEQTKSYANLKLIGYWCSVTNNHFVLNQNLENTPFNDKLCFLVLHSNCYTKLQTFNTKFYLLLVAVAIHTIFDHPSAGGSRKIALRLISHRGPTRCCSMRLRGNIPRTLPLLSLCVENGTDIGLTWAHCCFVEVSVTVKKHAARSGFTFAI